MPRFAAPQTALLLTDRRSGLDEHHQRLPNDPVPLLGRDRLRSLQSSSERVHVGHVHQHPDPGRIRRIDEPVMFVIPRGPKNSSRVVAASQ